MYVHVTLYHCPLKLKFVIYNRIAFETSNLRNGEGSIQIDNFILIDVYTLSKFQIDSIQSDF